MNGSDVCTFNIARSERQLYYMNNYLGSTKDPESLEEWEALYFNVTMSTLPFLPFTFYYCYGLPEKTERVFFIKFNEF